MSTNIMGGLGLEFSGSRGKRLGHWARIVGGLFCGMVWGQGSQHTSCSRLVSIVIYFQETRGIVGLKAFFLQTTGSMKHVKLKCRLPGYAPGIFNIFLNGFDRGPYILVFFNGF